VATIAFRVADVFGAWAGGAVSRDLRAELLPNGLVLVRDYGSGLTGVYTRDGAYRFGDLRVDAVTVSVMAQRGSR
jgi:hypothetical protein